MNGLESLTETPSYEKIVELEGELMKADQAELPTRHYILGGMYVRELLIRKGVCLTGRMHKTAHFNFVMKGSILVWTEQGMKKIDAPCILPSYPGAKRVGYALEDTIWATAHVTDKTDVSEIEEELIEPEEQLIGFDFQVSENLHIPGDNFSWLDKIKLLEDKECHSEQ